MIIIIIIAATVLLTILLGDLCFEGWYAYCPDIFSLYLLALNILSKQVIRLLWLVWVTAVIYFFNRFEWSVSEICSDIRAQPENNPQIEVLVGNPSYI